MKSRLMFCVTALTFGLSTPAPGETFEHGAAAGQYCGGGGNVRCQAGLICDYRHCSAPDNSGACVPIPTACTYDYRPVCGCDGKTYGNDCARRVAKVIKRADGPCK